MNELDIDDHHGSKLSVSLDHRDLECLDAASLLHNIGLYTGKKSYHKQSYRVIVVCGRSVSSIFWLEEFVKYLFQCMVVFYKICNFDGYEFTREII